MLCLIDSEEDDYGFSDDEEDEEDGASVLEEGDDEEGSEGDDAVAVEEKTEASPAVVVMAESPVKDKKHREKNDIGDKKERSSRLEPEEGPMTAGMRLKSGHRDRNAPRSAAGGAGLMAEINTICAELPNEGKQLSYRAVLTF